MKIFCSTYPFASVSDEPKEILERNGIELEVNPYGRKITRDELKKHLADKSGLIAGTEILDASIFDCAPNLKIIARVGIGLDGIDFKEVNKRKILVTYTPDAVSQAVAELTVANIINLARRIPQVHLDMKHGKWNRYIGFEIANKKIGIIGFGRVGQRVAKMLQGFSCELLVNDITPDEEIGSLFGVTFCSKEKIVQQADIITLHLPKTPITYNLVDDRFLGNMKNNACIINTSRGGIINEEDLYIALKNKSIGGAAIDVYEIEPYIAGRFCELDNTILTSHSGSCSQEARYLMELGAAQEILQYKLSQPPINPVPEDLILVERSKLVVPINAEWHEIINRTADSQNDRYNNYRKKWGQYPAHSIVGPNPLNIDIELVYNENEGFTNPSEFTFSQPTVNSKHMDWSLFKYLMEEIKISKSEMAVTLGFRGDPVYYNKILAAIKELKKTNSVETRLSTNGDFRDEKNLMENILKTGIDTLNLYVGYKGSYKKLNKKNIDYLLKISKNIEFIRMQKLLLGITKPRIRVFTDMELSDLDEVSEFSDFWGKGADVVAVIDRSKRKEKNYRLDKNVKWVCSRLWQRLMIAFDGTILACNYDFKGQLELGKYPETTIESAWNGNKLNLLRELHLKNSSHEINACRNCEFRHTELNKLLTI